MPHIHEKIDFGADVFIVNGDAVLLRFHDKYDEWFAPGGHVELDEDPEETAIREAKEETGLEVTLVGKRSNEWGDGDKEVLVPLFINRHPVSDTHEHVVFMYIGTAPTRELAPSPSEKPVEMRWFTRDELSDPKYGIRERVQHYARTALDKLAPL